MTLHIYSLDDIGGINSQIERMRWESKLFFNFRVYIFLNHWSDLLYSGDKAIPEDVLSPSGKAKKIDAKVSRPLTHDKRELSERKSVERLISLLRAFRERMNYVLK